jgi:ABC-type glycerol-3-phosphate transport system substrate-binding protein
MTKVLLGMAAVFAVMALTAGLVLAQSELPALEEKTSDGVQYVSAGFGLEEREAMMALAKDKHYNLKLEFVMVSGQYSSGAMVMIEGAKKKILLQAESEGPWFYAKLPHGHYLIAVTLNDKKKVQKVSVGKGLKTVVFRWK